MFINDYRFTDLCVAATAAAVLLLPFPLPSDDGDADAGILHTGCSALLLHSMSPFFSSRYVIL